MRQIFYIALFVACRAGRYIDQQSGRGLYLRYPVILCINFAFYKRSICREMSSGSNRCLGWTFAVFRIRPLVISICERGKTTLGKSKLFGALLIMERVCKKFYALSCFLIHEKVFQHRWQSPQDFKIKDSIVKLSIYVFDVVNI